MMVFVLAMKGASLRNQHVLLRTFNFCFKSLTTAIPKKKVDDDRAISVASPFSECSTTPHLSQFFSNFDHHPPSGYNIELVDRDAWGVSSGVARAWQGRRNWDPSSSTTTSDATDGVIDEAVNCHPLHAESDMDFEAIDNMRVRGNLFYKLERSSKEFEEYNLEFNRKKSSKKKDEKKENVKEAKKAKVSSNPNVTKDKLPKVHEISRSKSVVPLLEDTNDVSHGNKRTPTFNQLTGPYHEPFCLDIYISKGSVRACIVHRITSKVVAVAHSISKDMKFDLGSTKNKATCAAVGAILAQRALADDIYDVIYTPRKGERLEGKLQIVLQSIINNGINVKVKIKQRQRPKRSIQPRMA